MPLLWPFIEPQILAASPTNGFVVVSAKSEGVELSMRLPRETYAVKSLITARVRITNHTHHAIWLFGFPESCGGYSNPEIVVSDASGKQVYPPGVPLLVPPLCPPPGPMTLPAHQKVTTTVYAIARGPNLRAVLQFSSPTRAHGSVTVETRPLILQFGYKPAATVTIHTSPSGLSAIVHRPHGARGAMLYEANDNCASQDLQTGQFSLSWAETTQTTLSPSCPNPSRWVVVAGWPGYPVAQVNYTAP